MIALNLEIQNHLSIKSKLFKTLADPIRLKIIEIIGDTEKCVCEIVEELAIAQPLVSRHLRILREMGLIIGRKDGTKKLYKLSNPQTIEIIDTVDEVYLKNLAKHILQEVMT
ncbi:MAG: winged helix-turn-helix transcriptional regulator [Asgard group archaeon]|nr:winged helix-turn-helix transcriptional regulator [Asgard group archaeon]